MTATVHQLVEDPLVTRPDDVNIGLAGDQIFQRFLVRRIFREVEFEITEDDGSKTAGFITGFDDRCIQMSTTPRHEADEPHAKLIFWPIRSIEETGRKVEDLEHEHRSKIRSYSHALRAQCEKVLTGGTNGAPPSTRSRTYHTPRPLAPPTFKGL